MPSDSYLALSIDGISAELRVFDFEAHEAISQLSELTVEFASESAIDLASVVRKKAAFAAMSDGGDTAFAVHGVVSRIEAGHPQKGWHLYRVTVVSWPWLLSHRVDSRIFQDLTAPDIVKQVLQGAGYAAGTDFNFSVTKTYTKREYCVQYRESDWDFVCRLLEEEGIHYRFEQKTDSHVLLVADDANAYTEMAPATLEFRPDVAALSPAANAVRRFHFAQEVRPGKATLNDWSFLKPSLSLKQDKSGSANTDLEIYDQPGNYDVPADGTTRVGVRLEELQLTQKTGSGESTCPTMAAGCTFTLQDHPTDTFNAKYVVTRVRHWGRDQYGMDDDAAGDATAADPRNARYANEFELMPAAVLFRPPRVTRRPHIHGVQTAIVVGPSGEEIYVDQYGRVKVQFHWDRLGKNDDKSSCWIRVAQPWASAAFGAVFIPRIKDEVVVTFLEGDPDRPLIVGSVYHGTNVVPYALPDNKTRSTIKSNTSPGGGGSNELRFEDKKGSEEVFLHAQKDWTIGVENDKNQTVGHDETLQVGNDRTKTVKHDQTATVEHDDSLTVKNDQTLEVDHDRSVTVKNDHTESVQGKQSITVAKAQSITLQDKQDVSVAGKRSLTVQDDVTETFSAKLTVSVSSDVSETFQAKHTLSVTGDGAATIGGKQTVSITGDSAETVGGKKTFTVTGEVTITSGSSTVTIKPSGEITIQGVQMKLAASGPLQIQGATIDLKSDGPMTVKAPTVQSSADAMNTLKGAMLVLDGQMISVG